MVVLTEKAGTQLPIGGQADARAVAAERLRHRSDQADLPRRAIGEAVLTRRFAALVRDLLQRPQGVNALVYLRRGHDHIAVPVPVGIQRHELDKTHNHAALARKTRKGFDFVVIDAADQHRVYLRGSQGRVLRYFNTVHNRREGFGARNFLEFRRIEGIEADVDAA